MNRTELSSLGEFKLIEYLTQNTKKHHNSSIKMAGDDAAVLAPLKVCNLVSTDLLVEGIHFDLTYFPLKHLGYKAVVVNLSDIYAMNAQPKQITVSIAVSNRFSVEALHELYEGIHTACKHYKVDLIGGDTTSSTMGLVISVTAIGEAKEDVICYRNGAKVNDLICVSGDLGAAFMGLQILEREKQIFKENSNIQPDISGNDYLLERFLKPEARKELIDALHKHKILPTAMIDVSDGLASELFHICKQSAVGCQIYQDKIPLDTLVFQRAEDFNMDPYAAGLNGGEDYELLFTIQQSDYEKLNNIPEVSVIGHITDENSGLMIESAGSNFALTAQGWDAFKNN